MTINRGFEADDGQRGFPSYDQQPDFEVNLPGDDPAPGPMAVNDEGNATPAAVEGAPGTEDNETAQGVAARYRGTTSDPAFGYLLALALSIGLSPLIGAGQADMRYTLSWGTLALFGVMAWLFGSAARISEETPDNVVWGISFGLILGVPVLAFGGSTLSTAVDLLFRPLPVGAVLAYLVFVIPLAETLFFRGLMQENRPFWMIGLMGALWSVVLFTPMLDLLRYPFVALVIGGVLVMMNLTYSYVRQRNGLAAAWVCQIVVNLVVVFVPFISG